MVVIMMVKPILLCVLTMALVGTGALGQACERTLTITGGGTGLGAGDFEATLGKQILTITKVEPIRSSRILVLVAANSFRLGRQADFERLIDRLGSIDAIPANVSLAYGLYAEKMVLSGRFTSDPKELRASLDELVRQAKTGALGKSTRANSLMGQAFEFFQQPRPGDAVILISYSNGSGGQGAWLKLRFLESGLRLFVLLIYNPDLELYNIPGSYLAEGTGGWMMFLGRTGTTKKEEEASWLGQRNFWLHSIPTGYLVTVAIPDGTRAKEFSWRVKTKWGVLPYPDLLLCDNTTKDKDRVATAVQPRY